MPSTSFRGRNDLLFVSSVCCAFSAESILAFYFLKFVPVVKVPVLVAVEDDYVTDYCSQREKGQAWEGKVNISIIFSFNTCPQVEKSWHYTELSSFSMHINDESNSIRLDQRPLVLVEVVSVPEI